MSAVGTTRACPPSPACAAAAIRRKRCVHFCKRVGITKFNGTTDVALLEFDVRDFLNHSAPRRMAVLDPLKVVLENWSAEPLASVEVPNHPQNPETGQPRRPDLQRNLDRARRLHGSARRRNSSASARTATCACSGGHIIRCTGFEKDAAGNITLIRAEILPGTVGADSPEGVVCNAAIHWVDAATGIDAEVRLYDRLFTVEDPDAAEGGFISVLNPDSLTTVTAKIEPALADRRGRLLLPVRAHRLFRRR